MVVVMDKANARKTFVIVWVELFQANLLKNSWNLFLLRVGKNCVRLVFDLLKKNFNCCSQPKFLKDPRKVHKEIPFPINVLADFLYHFLNSAPNKESQIAEN